MKVKEAIEEVKQVFWVKYGIFGNKKADNIITILKQGEKYRHMWEELEELFEPGEAIAVPISNFDYVHKGLQTLKHFIIEIRLKHFPEPIKKNYQV